MKGSRDDDTPVTYRGETYCGINELGFTDDGAFVLDLWTTEPAQRRGGFGTTIPISPLGRRRESRCAYKVVSETKIEICDDWGSPRSLSSTVQVIAQLVQELEANEVPRRN